MEGGKKVLAFALLHLGQGGIERYVSLLTPQLVRAGYGVVLLTTEGPEHDVYAQDPRVSRVVLGRGAGGEGRSQRLAAALVEHRVDLVFFEEYYSDTLPADVREAERLGVPYVIHHHNVGSNFFIRANPQVDDAAYYGIYARAAAMIVLSRCDELYFRALGCRAHYFPNLLADVPPGYERRPKRNALVWVGRFARNKRPMDALLAFERVLCRHPDATLTFVGRIDGDPAVEELVREVRAYVAGREPLGKAVRLVGFEADVWSRLAEADVLLTTSEFEGFPYSLMEACAAGVPIAGYELPYLELSRGNEGFVATPQGDVDALSNAVGGLLADAELKRRASQAVRRCFERLRDFDQLGAYGRLIDGILGGGSAGCAAGEATADVVVRTTVRHAQAGAARLKRRVREVEAELARLRSSRAYRLGCLICRPYWLARDLVRALFRGGR